MVVANADVQGDSMIQLPVVVGVQRIAPLPFERHVRASVQVNLRGRSVVQNRETVTCRRETVERLIRRGFYKGPLNLNYVAIGGGASGTHPADLLEFARRTPDGAVLTIESIMRSVIPLNTVAIALGLHVRVGIEDNIWRRKGERMTSVQQIEQMVRISREIGRDVATGSEAPDIYQIGVQYSLTEETLAKLGMVPNREPGQRGFPVRAIAA